MVVRYGMREGWGVRSVQVACCWTPKTPPCLTAMKRTWGLRSAICLSFGCRVLQALQLGAKKSTTTSWSGAASSTRALKCFLEAAMHMFEG